MKPEPQPGTLSGELFDELEKLEGRKAAAFFEWKKSRIEMKKILSETWIKFKTDGEKKTVDHINALVDTDRDCYNAQIDEAAKERTYKELEDRLMSVRQMVSFRGY